MFELETLNLSGTEVTDAGMRHLKSLKRLTKLDLSSTKVTTAGARSLESLENLSELFTYNSMIGIERMILT